MTDNYMVSICCTAYNHELYIADALEGFLNQRTSFNFEVLIHDDASIDKTAEIIKSFERKYPDIVKPIYQKENQFSKGVPISRTFNYSRAKGKYIALCEGDDYWINPYKLQMQVDYMENHPDCTFCFTNGKIIDVTAEGSERVFIPHEEGNKKYFFNESRVYQVGELALLGFIPTASFLFPARILYELPDFYCQRVSGGDMKLKLVAASKGYSYYLNEMTCIYRTNVKNSLMSKWKTFNPEQLICHYQSFIDLLDNIDRYTNYQYRTELDRAKATWEFSQLVLLNDKELFTNERYKDLVSDLKLMDRIKLHIRVKNPSMYNKIRNLKRGVPY